MVYTRGQLRRMGVNRQVIADIMQSQQENYSQASNGFDFGSQGDHVRETQEDEHVRNYSEGDHCKRHRKQDDQPYTTEVTSYRRRKPIK